MLAADALAPSTYLETRTLGSLRCPPTSGITSTATVCFGTDDMSTTAAARPHTAQIAWSARTCEGVISKQDK